MLSIGRPRYNAGDRTFYDAIIIEAVKRRVNVPNSDAELMESLKKENKDFKKLCEEHEGLKKKIRELDKGKFHIPEQEAEIIRLKKLKLNCKDKIHQLLTDYRKNAQV